MYTITHYDNSNVWLDRQHYHLQPQHHQYIHSNSIDSATRLKHKEVELYKTESCRNWTELGHCRYGKKCRYAHGSSELRTVHRHNRYKTQICRAYHMDGSCPYGIRCTFVHDSDIQTGQEMRNSDDSYIKLPVPSSQPSQTNPVWDRGTKHRNEFVYTRRSSFGSLDDELSTSGSSSGDESLVSASLIDSNCNYYRHSDAKESMMKRQESIETMYDILYNNNFNNNNRTIIWM
ncbi:unnamed protein product [Mucor hiemalis]